MTHRLPCYCLCALLVELAGCYVPIATTAPVVSRTQGKGRAGFLWQIEYPAIDLATLPVTAPDPASPSRYPTSALPAGLLQIAIATSERIDLELGIDMAVFGVFPSPTGLNGGLRAQVVDQRRWELAIAGRAGFLYRTSGDHRGGLEPAMNVSARYLSASAAARLEVPGRPGAALNLQPMSVTFTEEGAADHAPLAGVAATLSVSVVVPVWRFEVMPMVWGGLFDSDNVRGLGSYAGLGLAFADRSRR